jgi:hypothetical protein
MLAYAMHLFRTELVHEVKIHPDGQYAQQIDFPGWLEKRGVRRILAARGAFEDAAEHRIVIHPQSGLSDVTANGTTIEASARAARSRHDIPADCRTWTKGSAKSSGA